MSSQKKILIVEDDFLARLVITKVIGGLDVPLHIDVAVDGVDGCERIEAHPDGYDLVLMDIHMPRLSGLDAAKRIRNNAGDPPRNTPIYAVTADSDFHHPLAVQSHGLDGVLAKPVLPEALAGLLAKYC